MMLQKEGSQIFQHYKKKRYKQTGVARHSETLEELVLYETLYDCELGNTWVRPKELFFGELEVDGVRQRRFEPLEFELEICLELTDEVVAKAADFLNRNLGDFQLEKLKDKILNHKKNAMVMAYDQGKMVGLKYGYALDDQTFYSALGAVEPSHRGLGLGRQILSHQHQWCQQSGFEKIQTKTLNRWQKMLLLNIRCGFQIIATEESSKGEVKIVLEKVFKTP